MSSAFQRLSKRLLEHRGTQEGTMMNHPCLRVGGEFFVGVGHDGELLLKLPSDRVDALIGQEIGRPFAPNGRRFKEWIAIPAAHSRRWHRLSLEALDFVDAKAKK